MSGCDLTPQQAQKSLEALIVQHAEAVDVGELVRDLRLVEERHDAEVLHHPGVIL